MNKLIVVVVLVTVSIVVGAAFFMAGPSSGSKIDENKLVDFAKCLAEKKVTMYGAEWCPHCKKQKALFGSSFKYVPYVECPENTKVCLEKKVDGYPTWIFPDGKRLQGEQSLEELSKESSCSLPKD